jgi:hypothetical protein
MVPEYGEMEQSHEQSQFNQTSFSMVGALICGFLCLSFLPLVGAIRDKLQRGEPFFIEALFCVLLPVAGIMILRRGRRDVANRLDLYELGIVCHYRSGRMSGCSYIDIAGIKGKYYERSIGTPWLSWFMIYVDDGTKTKVFPGFRDTMDAIDFLQRKLLAPAPLVSTLPKHPGG